MLLIAVALCLLRNFACSFVVSAFPKNYSKNTISDNFTELFVIIPYTEIAQMVKLHGIKGLPGLQIRNTFKQHFHL